MKLSLKVASLSLALAFSATAQAQFITRTFNVTGVSNAVVARFTIWIDAAANTYTVDIDNALPASSGAQVGTITGFGFNTPFVVASQTNDPVAGGSVALKAKWTQVNSGHTGLPTSSWSSDDFWNESTPYSLSPNFNQDYGVRSPSPAPAKGIQYGEKATFVFAFTQDITVANFAGFFSNSATATPSTPFDFSVRWQQTNTKANYLNPCYPEGSDKGGIDLTPFSDGELPPVPEPSTYGLMGAAALVGLVAVRRFKAKKSSAVA